MSVIAVDIGSSRIKALLAGDDGGLVDGRSVRTPQQSAEAGERSYPAGEIEAAVEALIAGLARSHRDDPVDTIVFSCLGTAMVPVDGEGRPLGAALAPADARPDAGMDAPELLGIPSEELFLRTGCDPRVSSFLRHSLWWQRTQPAVMARLYRFRSLRGFVVQELCGADAEDPSWASRTMLLEIETNEWSAPILAAAGLPPHVLPGLHPSTSTWPVRPTVRASLGLATDAIVVLGALDNCCAVFGAMDASEPGLVNIVGTYEHIAAIADLEDAFAVAASSDAIVHSYLEPHRYVAMTRIHLGGLLEQVAAHAPTDLEALLDAVAVSPTGLETPLTDEAIGAALRSGVSPGQVLQALLESAAGVLKRFVDAWESSAGSVARIRAVGGGARHDAALQLKANVLGRPLSTLATDECAGLGALRLAAVATRGLSATEACRRYPNPIDRTFQPRTSGVMA